MYSIKVWDYSGAWPISKCTGKCMWRHAFCSVSLKHCGEIIMISKRFRVNTNYLEKILFVCLAIKIKAIH